MTSPLVSIGMSVRNNQGSVSLAIQSILNQTFDNWELLLIDDGSTDDTRSTIEKFVDERIHFVSHPRSAGLPTRLNETIDMARGRYFARMDGDDVSYPNRLERQLALMEAYPEVALTGAAVVVFDGDGRVTGKRSPPELHEEICSRPHAGFPIAHPTYFGRIELFRRYRYSVNAHMCEDQDLLVRAYRRNRFANVGEILLGYREQLRLRKIWRTRRHLGESLWDAFIEQRQPLTAIRAVVEQCVKAAIDLVAIGTGLDYRVLSHRAGPITDTDRLRWMSLWHSLNRQIADGPR